MKEIIALERRTNELSAQYKSLVDKLNLDTIDYVRKQEEAKQEEARQMQNLKNREAKALQETVAKMEAALREIEKEREPLTRKIESESDWYYMKGYTYHIDPVPRELDEQEVLYIRSKRVKQLDTLPSVMRVLKLSNYDKLRELTVQLLQQYLNANALCELKAEQARAVQAEEARQIRETYAQKTVAKKKEWQNYYAKASGNWQKRKDRTSSAMMDILISKELKELVRTADQLQKQASETIVWESYAPPKAMTARLPLTDVKVKVPVDIMETENFRQEDAQSLRTQTLSLPLSLDLFRSNIVVITAEKSNLRADGADKLAAWRLLARLLKTMPPEICGYSVFDTLHQGMALGRFIDLTNMGSSLRFDAFTAEEAAAEHRKKLKEKPPALIREMAGRCRTLYEYVRQGGRQPLTWYADLSFPEAPSDQLKADLTELIKHSGITGTSFLFVTTGKGLQAITEIARNFPEIPLYHLDCAKLTCTRDNCSKPMKPGRIPDSRQISALVQAMKTHFTDEHNKSASAPVRPKNGMTPLRQNKFAPFSDVLSLPFAEDSQGNMVDIKLGGSDGIHGFISGYIGSGKSTLLHSIILTACRKYSPTDLEIWLADYKLTDFDLYKTNTPPHITFIGISTAEEFTYGFLDKIEAEAMRRVALFQKFGVKDLGSYRKHAGEPGYANLPVLLIIIDEFQIMSQTVLNDSYYKDKLENSLRLYRAHGFRFLLASQTFSKGLTGLSEAAKDQIGVRIAMRNQTLQDVKDSLETSAPYTDDMIEAIRLMDPGDIIMPRNIRDDKGRLQDIRLEKYRGINVTEADIHHQLATIRKAYEKYIRIPNPLYINTNVQFPWDPADMDALDRMEPRRSTEMRLYLGRCDQLRPCFGLDFSRKTNENLSIIGGEIHQRWELITSILNSVRRNNYQTFVFLAPESDLDHDHGDALRALCDRIPRITLLDTYEKWCCTLSDLAEQVSDKDNRVEIFCLFLAPENAWEAFEELPDYETVYENVSSMLKYASSDMPVVVSEKYNAIPLIRGLFELGPRRGLHCIIEAGTYSDLCRMGDIADSCRHRIAFHISKEDCMSYLGSGYYYDSIGIYAAYSCGGNNAPRLVPYKYVP